MITGPKERYRARHTHREIQRETDRDREGDRERGTETERETERGLGERELALNLSYPHWDQYLVAYRVKKSHAVLHPQRG